MCNYSRMQVRDFCVRRAKVGDELELVHVAGYIRGFARMGVGKKWSRGRQGIEVTCLRLGTEVAFAKPPFFDGVLTWVECDNGERVRVTDRADTCVAKIAGLPGGGAVESYVVDGVEFPDGRAIGLCCLRVGERIKVLQLPAPRRRRKARARTRRPATLLERVA